MMKCPWCRLQLNPFECILGSLGRLVHIRCRYCGGQFELDEGQLGDCDDEDEKPCGCPPWNRCEECEDPGDVIDIAELILEDR